MPGEEERGRNYCLNSSGGAGVKTTFTGCEVLGTFSYLLLLSLKRVQFTCRDNTRKCIRETCQSMWGWKILSGICQKL